MNQDSRIHFEGAIEQVATNEKVVLQIVRLLINSPAVLGSIAKFAAETVGSKVAELAKKYVIMASTLPPLSVSDSSSNKDKKKHKERRFNDNSRQDFKNSASSGKGKCPMTGLLMESERLF